MEKKQWLVIIIDNNKLVEPKKYTTDAKEQSKEQAIAGSKALYEKNTGNKMYESYTFLHIVNV